MTIKSRSKKLSNQVKLIKTFKKYALDSLNGVRSLAVRQKCISNKVLAFTFAVLSLIITVTIFIVMVVIGNNSTLMTVEQSKSDYSNKEITGIEKESSNEVQTLSIVTFDTRLDMRSDAQNGYFQQTADINEAYATKWNYPLYHMLYSQKSHTHTAKATLMHQFMESGVLKTDWLLYMDADAFVSRFDWNLDDVLRQFVVSSDIHFYGENQATLEAKMFAEHCPGKVTDRKLSFSAGSFLVRNSDIGHEIIREWNASIAKYPRMYNHYPGDQGVFSCALSNHSTLGKYIAFNSKQNFTNISGHRHGGYRDAFVQHYTSGGKRDGIGAKWRQVFANKTSNGDMPFHIISPIARNH